LTLGLRVVFDNILCIQFFVFEDEAVRLQNVLRFPGVLPPACDDMRVDFIVVNEEPLDSIRYFKFASPRRFEIFDSVEDRG
jgi:hypothetical protein